MTGITREARADELAWVAAPALNSHVVESVAQLAEIADAEPWRIRVTDKGEAAILGRWRAHLPDCAVLGLWCSPRRVPVIITDLLEVARERGFARLIGPLAPEREARLYLDAGMRVVQRVIVMRLDRPGAKPAEPLTAGLRVRPATHDDLDALMRIDAECFDPFWHYDREMLERLVLSERVVVGVLDSRTVGYTLSTLRAGDGSLGRLAVTPHQRERGIGRALAAEAVAWMAAGGAHTVALSTQEDNMASRRLYHSIGFRETGDVLIACSSGAR